MCPCRRWRLSFELTFDDPVGDERIPAGAGPDAAAERLAGGPHRCQATVPMVLCDLYVVVRAMPSRVVIGVLGGVSRAAGYERWTAGANGADDARSRCGQTHGARDGLCSASDSSGPDPGTGAGWNDSSSCFLAVAISGQCAGVSGRNCLGGVVPAG